MQSKEENYYILTLKGALYVALTDIIGNQVDIDTYITPIYDRLQEIYPEGGSHAV